jgi:glycerol-3-phosphate acyltransferase PlsY
VGSVWVMWLALFVGAAIPLNRILPWVSQRLVELDSTLDKPRLNTSRIYAPMISIWVILLSIGKGWLAWELSSTFYGVADWVQPATLAIAIIGHSWTIFSDDHPSPFWVILGIFLSISYPIGLIFLAAFLVLSLVFNLPHLAIVLAVVAGAYEATSAGLISPIGLPVLIGITILTVMPQLTRLFDDVPPTLWGLFVKRP